MRSLRGWFLVLVVGLGACQECGEPALPDGGEGGGGGEVGGGGGEVDSGVETDAGPRLIGCEVDAGSVSTPECTPSPSGCQLATDCPTRLCLKLATGGVCTQPCGDAGGCAPDWRCQRRWTGSGEEGFCVPAGRTR